MYQYVLYIICMFYKWLDNGKIYNHIIVFKVLASTYSCTVGHIITTPINSSVPGAVICSFTVARL